MPEEVELEQYEGFVHCDRCSMLNMCKYGNAGVSIRLGKFEGVIIMDHQVKDLNRLIRIMNKLVKQCPLVRLLEQNEARVGVKKK